MMVRRGMIQGLVLLSVVTLWASVASAYETVCVTGTGLSILGCGACTAEQYTEVVPKSEKRSCPPGYIGYILTRWTETWAHDVTCEPVGNGQCGLVHYCNANTGWTLMGALPGPFTEEVQIDHATRIGQSAYQVTDFCRKIPVPVPVPVFVE